MLDTLDMARATGNFLVLALEQKVGLAVIKIRLIQLDDTSRATTVISMARAAITCGMASVVAHLVPDVGTHLLMAICTKLGLRCRVQSHVTVIAIGFQFGMGFDDLARHQYALQVLGTG